MDLLCALSKEGGVEIRNLYELEAKEMPGFSAD